MNNQTRQSYDIDDRRAGTDAEALGAMWDATDNEGGKQYLRDYIQRKRMEENPNMEYERSQEGRIVMAGPGDGLSGYRNPFRAMQ